MRGANLSIQIAQHLLALFCGIGDAEEAFCCLDIAFLNRGVWMHLQYSTLRHRFLRELAKGAYSIRNRTQLVNIDLLT